MSAATEIERIERLLPGEAAPEGAEDPRWQAILELHEFIRTDPEPVWRFARRWGDFPDEDLRTAIAVCVLEHLLEHHFDIVFPRVELAVRESRLFADCFSRCGCFGQSNLPTKSTRFDALQASISIPAV